MPAGNTNGSKLMSRRGLVSSLSTGSRVNVPTSTCSRPSGHGMVASLVAIAGLADGDDQMPLQRMLVDARDQRVKKIILVSFGSPAALAGSNGCTGTIDQRTGVDVPAASMKRNALRPLKVLLSKPDDTLHGP